MTAVPTSQPGPSAQDYLNAARAHITSGRPDAPEPYTGHVSDLAHRSHFRAAVESVWEARGRHDAGTQEKCPVCYTTTGEHKGWCAIGQNALDVVRPAEDGPAGYRAADMPKPDPGYRQAANRDGLVMQHTCGNVRAFDRPPADTCHQCGYGASGVAGEGWRQLYLRNEDAPAALDGGQPVTAYIVRKITSAGIEDSKPMADRRQAEWCVRQLNATYATCSTSAARAEVVEVPATGETPDA